MEYQISIQSLKLVRNELEISYAGCIKSEDELLKPKLILHFFSDNQDRRIPLVISAVYYAGGYIFFSGSYVYLLDCIFLDGNLGNEWSVYLNCQFGNFYEEKVDVDLTPKQFAADSKAYNLIPDGKRWIVKCSVNPENIRSVNRQGKGIKAYNVFSFILSIVLSPWFLCTAYLAEKGYLPYASDRSKNGKTPMRRIVGDMNVRIKLMSSHKISPFGCKMFLFKRMLATQKHKSVLKNRVGFISVRRQDLSGNMEFVYQELKKNDSLDIKMVLPGRDIRSMSIKQMRQVTKVCATSKVLVFDEYTSFLSRIQLKPETKVVQLWHACGAFKTFGFSRLGKPGGTVQESLNHRQYDCVTVSSSDVAKWYAEGFGVSSDKVYATGVPRTDIFFDSSYSERVKEEFYDKYPQCKGKRMIMFAPTFRGDDRKNAHYPMEQFELQHLLEHIADDYMIIIKHHPFVKKEHPVPEQYKDRVLDLSRDSEINDLLFITDVLITDYSSVVYEASLLNIPMVFYTFDLKEYIQDRDFYSHYESFVPGRICYTLKELEQVIIAESYKHEKVKQFAEKNFEYMDGQSSKRVAELIAQMID